jgi:heat-inducible transcriptional repressor
VLNPKKCEDMNVRDEILRSVVMHYISESTPIGSVQLQKQFGIDVSSATIRNYFKRLVSEGLLEQEHSSSGRVPSYDALLDFWSGELDTKEDVAIDNQQNFVESAHRFGIYALIQLENKNSLVNMHSYDTKYIVLEFDEGEILLPYSNALARFAQEFMGTEVMDLLRLSKQMGVIELEESLEEFLSSFEQLRTNKNALIEIAYKHPKWSDQYFDRFLDGSIIIDIDEGVNTNEVVPKGCVLGKQECVFAGHPATMLFLGEASRNYQAFLKSIEGGLV